VSVFSPKDVVRVAVGRALCHAEWLDSTQLELRSLRLTPRESPVLGEFMHHYLTIALLFDRTAMVRHLAECYASRTAADPENTPPAEASMICALAALAWIHKSVRRLADGNFPEADSRPSALAASPADIWALSAAYHLFSQHIAPTFVLDSTAPYPLTDDGRAPQKFTLLRDRIAFWSWLNPWTEGLQLLHFRFSTPGGSGATGLGRHG
jgi:hypothetical protein